MREINIFEPKDEEVFKFNGVTLKCIRVDDYCYDEDVCNACYFSKIGCKCQLFCNKEDRSDNNHVYFKEIKPYTIKDVIIDPKEGEKYIGKECYFSDYPMQAVELANDDKAKYTLEHVSLVGHPFRTKELYSFWVCIIPVREGE